MTPLITGTVPNTLALFKDVVEGAAVVDDATADTVV